VSFHCWAARGGDGLVPGDPYRLLSPAGFGVGDLAEQHGIDDGRLDLGVLDGGAARVPGLDAEEYVPGSHAALTAS
jgi:hypothetical protein